eukprot:CAMPEP_0180337902 /NCGR_PEP_ID=MMETSP0988-20121125/45635_1 /TAXON_ID=697907 /ORGANISM="non described non described, Strain CCMP2293" /LENGTH=60 /DNA_ID=CAMNT_0022326289 /DNA_START=1 /DNA_END=180 /DNA_ORIENTATION=-
MPHSAEGELGGKMHPSAEGTIDSLFPEGEDFLGRARLLYRGLGENVFQEALTTGVFLGLY